MHRGRLLLAGGIAGVVAVVLGLACIPEEEKTNYGGPEGLHGRELPKPLLPSGNVQPGDGGTKGICEGGADPPDAGTCTVSWSKDIYAYIKGTGHCGDQGCHAPQPMRSQGQQPPISATDGNDAYNTLVAYTNSNFTGRRYIDPCSTDPATSAIRCNLTEINAGKAACGTLMPDKTTGAQAPDMTFLTTLDTWLKCGAPNN